jgi:predicted Zn-dependent protease
VAAAAVPPHQERVRSAAATGRDVLARGGVERWEMFTKASVTRELELAPGAAPREVQVEEMGVAVRTSRARRAGFAAASGLEVDAARRAIDGACAVESELPFDPLPPARLLGTAATGPARPLPPRGWAHHAADQLAKAVASVSGGRLRLRRSLLQEGTFSWLLQTSEGFVSTFDGTAASMLSEVQPADRRGGIWREWHHIADPDGFDPVAAAHRVADRALLVRGRVVTGVGLSNLILAPEVSARLLAALAPLLVVCRHPRDPLPGLLDGNGRLASDALTLVDDRLDPDAPITGPCDGEGLPPARTLLVERGVPRHRLASYRDALAFGETPRGGALRLSYRDYPATAIANLRVATDEGLPSHDMLQRAETALYLLRPLAPVAVDLAAGGYRIVASGVWLEHGRVRGWHPVVELRGSLARLLGRIEAVGTDLAWFQADRGCVGAPSMLIRSQPVVG